MVNCSLEQIRARGVVYKSTFLRKSGEVQEGSIVEGKGMRCRGWHCLHLDMATSAEEKQKAVIVDTAMTERR